jgi:hypothetical protein
MAKIIKVPTGAVHWFKLKASLNAAAQAATLKAAAQSGAPFCEE